MSDSTHSILQSTKRFLGGTMLSRISGLLRDVAMASAFGTQEAVAAFLVAFRFAHLLRRLFGEGAMQSAFIPHFETLRRDDPQRAGCFFRDLVGTLSVGLTGLIAISMLILAGCLLLFELAPGTRDIISLTLLLMPSLLFICLFGLNASLLQCNQSFFTSGVAPVAFNTLWVIGVLCLWNTPVAKAMEWLSIWVLAACFCQWLITMPRVFTILKEHCRIPWWRGTQLFSPDVRRLVGPLLLGILGVAAAQVNNAFDAIFARYASEEGPAFLWYAMRMQQLPLALFGVAISGALLPPLTRALKAGDKATYLHFLEFALRRSVALMLPISGAIFVLGDTSVNLLYGRGDFSDFSTVGTTQCLWCYAIGLLPMTLVLVLAPAFYAGNNMRTPALISLVAMSLNIVLNGWLIGGLGFGPASVALATSVSAWVNVALLARALPDLSTLFTSSTCASMAKVALVTLIACLTVVSGDIWILRDHTTWAILQGNIPPFPREFFPQISRFFFQSILFAASVTAGAWLLQADDLLRLLQGRRERVAAD